MIALRGLALLALLPLGCASAAPADPVACVVGAFAGLAFPEPGAGH
jgi:hypothetical protein